jgi:hypothetical protein
MTARMSFALHVVADLAAAREDLERHDRDVALRRVERDDGWRTEQVDLIDELQAAVDRLCRFHKEEGQ